LRTWSRAALLGLAWLYLAGLGGWFVANRVLGDRWWWLFILNALALYLFAPLPLLAVAVAIVRQRALWLGLAAAIALFLALYGGLWVHRPPPTNLAGPSLTVMSYNVLGYNDCPECVVAAIRASGADLITLQELSPAVAAAIAWDLSSEYRYQILAPKEGVTGLGAISRLPLRATGETLPGTWVGTPQVLALTLDGTRVLVVNAHPRATNPALPAVMAGTVRERYRQAQTLVAFAQTHPGPLLYPCDCNTADQNDAYRLIATAWHDSWREAGIGWGQTFPGTDSSGHSMRLVLHGFTILRWLVRIDYVWHSSHWRAVEAWIGPWDGHSDHRPTIARLVLVSR
jgi:endonuclease/exonuclease/phosphatase (EEP) superfamily protein YafD